MCTIAFKQGRLRARPRPTGGAMNSIAGISAASFCGLKRAPIQCDGITTRAFAPSAPLENTGPIVVMVETRNPIVAA